MITAEVLDKGYVTLVDVMGDDKRIVDAARTSYGGERDEFTKGDIGLLRYLMRQSHWTPYEMVQFTFKMKLPIFVARHIIRHRTAKVNEMSGRYTVLPNEVYIPEKTRMNVQSVSNKQGSAATTIENTDEAIANLVQHTDKCFGLYEDLLEDGLSKELSRMVLPLNTYTEWYWTIDLRNLFNFLWLRLDNHTQYESRMYAQAVSTLVRPHVPHAMEAFEEYQLYGMKLSRSEQMLLATFMRLAATSPAHEITRGTLKTQAGVTHMGKREWNEFLTKLELLGVNIDNDTR